MDNAKEWWCARAASPDATCRLVTGARAGEHSILRRNKSPAVGSANFRSTARVGTDPFVTVYSSFANNFEILFLRFVRSLVKRLNKSNRDGVKSVGNFYRSGGINFLSARTYTTLGITSFEGKLRLRKGKNPVLGSDGRESAAAGSKKEKTVKFRKELGRKGGVGSLIPLGAGSNLGVSQREELCLLTQEVIAAPAVREE